MSNYIEKAREAVASYESFGDTAIVDFHYLIAVIVGPSVDPEICLKLSSVNNLCDMSIDELQSFGLTKLQALRLHSAFLLSSYKGSKTRYAIRSPEDAYEYLKFAENLTQENFIVLGLNSKNEVLFKKTVFIGTVNSCVVHPREIFKEAIKRSCVSIVATHNHPSGNPYPSPEDRQVSKRLVEASNVIGIELLDFLIIGKDDYYSFQEEGLLG